MAGLAEPEQASIEELRISHFSGKPVPRFESLKYSAVNGRSGPSLQHPIRWRYERAGLPVLILKESEDWRFVQDPDGAEVWVHKRMLSSDITAFVARDAVLYAAPDIDSAGVARLRAGAIVDVMDRRGGWLRLSVDGHRGWLSAGSVWASHALEDTL